MSLSRAESRLPWLAARAACTLAVVFVLWDAEHLPMVDLPQLASLTAVWRDFEDPQLGYASSYRLNFFTPYLVPYVLMRLFAEVGTVAFAVKAVVTSSVLATPLAYDHLLRGRGCDRWWALLAFPLAFGNSFYWGFISFMVAIPIAIVTLSVGLRHIERPRLGSGVSLAVLSLLLFFSHLMAFVPCIAMLGVAAVWRGGGQRSLAMRTLPLAASLPVLVAWSLTISDHPGFIGSFVVYDLGFERFLFPAALISQHHDPQAAFVVVVTTALLFAIARPSLKDGLAPWLPFLVALIFVLFFPQNVGQAYVADRLSAFLPPTLMLGLMRRDVPRAVGASRLLIVAYVATSLVVLHSRLRAFDRDVGQFDEVLARAQRARTLLYLNFDHRSGDLPGNPFMHFGAWYQARQGGRVGYSFAEALAHVVRYRPGAPLIDDGAFLSWEPRYFEWERHGRFDYYLLRASQRFDRETFLEQADANVKLVAEATPWFLYERRADD